MFLYESLLYFRSKGRHWEYGGVGNPGEKKIHLPKTLVWERRGGEEEILSLLSGNVLHYTLQYLLPLMPWSPVGGKVKASVVQLCLTLWNPMDCSPPGSSVHEILQARILEWVAVPLSRGSSPPRDWTQVSSIAGRLFTIWATILVNLLSRRATFSHKWKSFKYSFPFDVCAGHWNQLSISLDSWTRRAESTVCDGYEAQGKIGYYHLSFQSCNVPWMKAETGTRNMVTHIIEG